jgi:hypothetical protein
MVCQIVSVVFFSEKMKNASTHHETEYAVFMESKFFAHSQLPRARANDHDAMDEHFSVHHY